MSQYRYHVQRYSDHSLCESLIDPSTSGYRRGCSGLWWSGDHFAITAREFGLPAICGTLRATHLIPEGAQVNVDADVGVVTWV